MRQFFYFLVSLLFIVGCSPKAAQLAGPASSAPAAAQNRAPGLSDTTLLWKLTAPEATTSSYLFGTIHLIPEEDYFMPAKVTEAINVADEVVFEIDPRDMQDPMQMMALISKINMRGDTSLADLLSPAAYATVEQYFTNSGMPFFIFKRMKPLFLSAMVGQDLPDMSGGGMPELGGGMTGMKSYEMELTKVAEGNDQKIGGLETMEFQLGLFDSIPYRAQAQMLYDAVTTDNDKADDGTPNEMDRMVDMYRRQAVAEMANMMSEETKEVSRFEELLLTKRNQNWVPIIQQALGTDKATFYAVGAGHLGGPNGVIALLRKEGVAVDPVY